jgi:DNA-binding beta-propeller fold protein YncE
MRMESTCVLCMAAAALLAGCRSGDEVPQPEPEASGILAVRTPSVLRAYGPPGTADPGTQAQVVYPYSGQDQVDYEGSFTITIPTPQQGWAYPMPTEVHVNLTSDGEVLLAKAPIIGLDSRVSKPIFPTGAGPNDMVFGNGSLYVANSFDNTVVRYDLDGAELSRASFAEYASPSYLGLTDSALYVVANGSNTLTGHNPVNLAALDPPREQDISLGGLTFPGPGKPGIVGNFVYIPMAMILEFGETTEYDLGSLLFVGFDEEPLQGLVDLSGDNGQQAYYDRSTGHLLVTTAGQMQFDESFRPFVTTDSYLDVFDGSAVEEPLVTVDLGRIGAGPLSISTDSEAAYIGSALSGNLYKVDLTVFQVLRGEDNPIVLTEEFTYISDVAITPDGRYVLATSFNTDELYVVDAEFADNTVNPGPYPAPFDLRLDPELMAGCLNVEIDPTPRADGCYTAYVLYGVANAVAKVELF